LFEFVGLHHGAIVKTKLGIFVAEFSTSIAAAPFELSSFLFFSKKRRRDFSAISKILIY